MEKSKLEEEFKKTQELAEQEIDAALSKAHTALKEAMAISEKYGVPFYASISPLGQGYRPSSFEEKWGEILDELREYDICLPEYEGWQHSAVC